MQNKREEFLRIAKELGLPVTENTTVTDILQLLNTQPEMAPELLEALEVMLGAPKTIDASCAQCA